MFFHQLFCSIPSFLDHVSSLLSVRFLFCYSRNPWLYNLGESLMQNMMISVQNVRCKSVSMHATITWSASNVLTSFTFSPSKAKMPWATLEPVLSKSSRPVSLVGVAAWQRILQNNIVWHDILQPVHHSHHSNHHYRHPLLEVLGEG